MGRPDDRRHLARGARDYDDEDLFTTRGRYGAWDWASVGTMGVASVIGWGLVINLFADAASWNNWQGYLLGPLGLGGKDGDWAYANLGVLVALVLGPPRLATPAARHRAPAGGAR